MSKAVVKKLYIYLCRNGYAILTKNPSFYKKVALDILKSRVLTESTNT